MAKRFNKFMLSGKVNSALRLLSDTESAGILPTNKKTVEPLKGKHPVGALKYNDLLQHDSEKLYEEYAYEEINDALIYKLHMKSREQRSIKPRCKWVASHSNLIII